MVIFNSYVSLPEGILISKVFKSTKPRILEKSLGCWMEIFQISHSCTPFPALAANKLSWKLFKTSMWHCHLHCCDRSKLWLSQLCPGPSSEKWRKMAGSTVSTNKKGSEIQQPGHNPTGIFLTKLIYKSLSPSPYLRLFCLSASSLQLRVT